MRDNIGEQIYGPIKVESDKSKVATYRISIRHTVAVFAKRVRVDFHAFWLNGRQTCNG